MKKGEKKKRKKGKREKAPARGSDPKGKDPLSTISVSSAQHLPEKKRPARPSSRGSDARARVRARVRARKKESKKNDIPEGSIGKKKQRFLFFLFQKNPPKPSFQSINRSQSSPHTLTLQFLSAGPSTCIPTHPKKKRKKPSASRVCLTTHQPVCVQRLTSHPSKAFLHLPMAYGSRRVCFWSRWVGAAPRQTLLHAEARHRDLHRTAPPAYMVHNVSLGQFETIRNLQLQKMYWQLEHKSEPHKQDVHLMHLV